MNRLLLRLIALVLIPCLVGDASSTSATPLGGPAWFVAGCPAPAPHTTVGPARYREIEEAQAHPDVGRTSLPADGAAFKEQALGEFVELARHTLRIVEGRSPDFQAGVHLEVG